MAKLWVIIIVINLIILGCAAVFIAWLADRVKFPEFAIDQGAINHFNFTNDNFLSANFIFVVRSHNIDSKYSVFYDHVAVSVYHDNYSLAYETLIHFAENNRKDDIVFTSHPIAKNVTISDGLVAANIRNETKSSHLELEVMIRASVMFEKKRWKKKQYLLKMICDPVVINLNTGKTVNRTDCIIDNYTTE